MDNMYKRGTTWSCRIWVDKKEIRRSLRTSSRSEAIKRRDKLAAEIDRLKIGAEPRRTWPDAKAGWEEGAAAQLRPNVAKRYRSSLRQVDATLKPLHLDEIDRKVIGRIAHRPGVTNATRRRDLTAISSVLAWAVAQGWLEENRARLWDRSVIRERRDPIVLPDEADVDAVIAAAPGNFARLIALARHTGMRQEEVASLEWSQIDLNRQAINLTKTKTGRARSVPLTSAATGTLTGTVRHITAPAVFWHDDGKRYGNVGTNFAKHVRRVERARAKAAAKLGQQPTFRRFRFHDLRHLFAVNYLRDGGGIYALQKTLGHSSITTTEIYLDYLTPDEAGLAMAPPRMGTAS